MRAGLVCLVGLMGCSSADVGQDVGNATAVKGVTKADREKYIATAQIWSQADFDALGSKDLLVGPTGKGAFNAIREGDSVSFPKITCTFVEPSRPGELG